jgi:hypothetical protein
MSAGSPGREILPVSRRLYFCPRLFLAPTPELQIRPHPKNQARLVEEEA